MPILHGDPWAEIVLADAFHDALSQHHIDRIQIIPLDASFQAIDLDSTDSGDYLRSYGERLRLDYTVLLRVDSLADSERIVLWKVFQPAASFTLRDTLSFSQAEETIRRICNTLIQAIHPTPTLSTPFKSPPAPLWRTMGQARFALLTDDWSSAEKRIDAARLHYPDNRMLCLLNADVQIAKRISVGRNPKLAETQACLMRLPDSSADRNLRLAQIHILDEAWNQAEEFLHLVLDKTPDDAGALFWLTRLHPDRYAAFGFSSREKILKKVIKLNPAAEKARLSLAESYFFRHQFNRARRCYQDLLKIHPRSLDGWLALGKLAVLEENFPEVIRIYENILKIDPENADAYYNLGIVYYHDDKTDLARKIFQKAVDLNDHPDAHFYLGVIDEAAGEREAAIHHFRRRLQLRSGPDDVFAEEARKHLYDLIQQSQDAFQPQAG